MAGIEARNTFLHASLCIESSGAWSDAGAFFYFVTDTNAGEGVRCAVGFYV